MRNHVNLLGSYAIDLLEESFASVGHHNEAVREFIELVHQRLLIRIWLAQDGVQRRYHWHVEVAQKSQKMAASWPAVDAKLVLDQDYLHVVDVEEIGCAAIGIEFLFVDLKSDPSWIVVAFGPIIYRAHDALTLREFRRNSITNVRGEGCDAALARKMIPEKGYLLDVGGYSHGLVRDQLSRCSRMEMNRFASAIFEDDRMDQQARRATPLTSTQPFPTGIGDGGSRNQVDRL
jgi:hypothetical protein